MTTPIEAILFDVGGTLRYSIPKEVPEILAGVQKIIALLDAGAKPEEFYRLLAERLQAYRRWARETLTDVDERTLWTRWLLPDWPAGQVGELAVQLNEAWRTAVSEKVTFPEVKEVIQELFRRGYRLGIVSNTVSSVETPRTLESLKLTGYFETVTLSCQAGVRKPNPGLLLEAARRMAIDPAKCAYIGDLLHRDVPAAQEAGLGKVIIRRSAGKNEAHQARYPNFVPDGYIDDLTELLALFPPRQPSASSPVKYVATLSTMWAKNNFSGLPDFFEGARRLGFTGIELNHQISSAMLAGIDLSCYPFSSVHEPCPADISATELKRRDWLISSPDEDKRLRGLEAVQRSIDLAHQLHAPVVVIHCGSVSDDLSTERELRTLFEAGKAGTDEYLKLKQRMQNQRAALSGACLAAVKMSLLELLDYTAPSPIRLGLENRYHYFDVPSLDEMADLLTLAGPDRLGFIYDVGHAYALDRLGFFAHEEWLRRFASRIIEVHLHDVVGVNDHYAPGLGEVDFRRVASYLPEDALRTFELQMINSPEQVKAGLRYLEEIGCIQQVPVRS